MKLLRYSTFIIAALLILGACSRTKDIFTARTYHRMVSKYNILFNGEQALLKARTQLKKQHVDDYDDFLSIYREGTEETISGVKPDLEKSLEKGSKTIQNHSMLIDGKQKNNYIDDAYLLMGKAHYFKQDYAAALETFNYVIQKFRDAEIRAEAELWAAKTETGMENFIPAKARFEKLYSNTSLARHLNADVFASFAHLEFVQGHYEEAYQLLIQAAEKTEDKELEVRWLYICGQLLAKQGQDYEASQMFDRVIRKGPPYDLLFNAQLNQARNYDIELMDPSKAYDDLEKMLRDEKNYDNRDQIYYVMAEVAQKLGEELDRDDYLNKSIRVSTQNDKQKGLSYLWLAEIRFDDKEYEKSQAYYDSCYQFLPKNHPKYAQVAMFKKSLGRLVANLQTIALQDSLQALASLSDADQLKAINEIIDRVKEADEEALRAKEREMDQLAFNSGTNNGSGIGGLAGVGNANQSFYFYNPSIRSSGVSSFVAKWGNRKLEDNWRRKDKSVILEDPTNTEAGANGEGATGEKELDPRYDPQTYLAQIPNDSAAMDTSHSLIQMALLDNAILYKEDIKDLLAASESVLELLQRYPDYQDRARAWYLLYRIYLLKEDEANSTKYKNLILSTYPKSEYAYLILNEGKDVKDVDESEAKRAYAAAYQDYESKRYRQALSAAKTGFEAYEDSRYGARFLLLTAYCEAGLRKMEELRTSLEEVLKRFPRTPESAEAQKILNAMGQDAKAEGDEKSAKKTATYRSDFSSQHRYVLLVPNGKVSANQVQINLSDFNSKYFPNNRLLVKSILMGTEWQVVMVSGLANQKQAQEYYRTLNSEKALEKLLISVDFKQFVISNANFTDFYKNQDIKGYQAFFDENYK
ncbi:type IX secretion system periplasmic lipoprotein PorW/SprE [Croceimicrobium hydrocarbonivorans]|uniref:Tetratricopeptide repeat protein n=1 Tax=Croceimicrobium hydrocarbonivorans TaxID=2761580 RepID=A0A7H0VJG7_9FLAO|nr:tetratricopeptide repeat protein [Croceimicrobium hydrocarbonivorans]QNR25865.1 hypothetical protein H4K34_08470 [Croceimicrobium hydrocarbonivorans]